MMSIPAAKFTWSSRKVVETVDQTLKKSEIQLSKTTSSEIIDNMLRLKIWDLHLELIDHFRVQLSICRVYIL